MQDEQERSEQWSRVLKSMRLLGGSRSPRALRRITWARHPQPTFSAPSAPGSRPGTTLVDDLGLGGSSTKRLVHQGPGSRRPGQPTNPESNAPSPGHWDRVVDRHADSCAAADCDAPLTPSFLSTLPEHQSERRALEPERLA